MHLPIKQLKAVFIIVLERMSGDVKTLLVMFHLWFLFSHIRVLHQGAYIHPQVIPTEYYCVAFPVIQTVLTELLQSIKQPFQNQKDFRAKWVEVGTFGPLKILAVVQQSLFWLRALNVPLAGLSEVVWKVARARTVTLCICLWFCKSQR